MPLVCPRTITVRKRNGQVLTFQTSLSDQEAHTSLTTLVRNGKLTSSFATDLAGRPYYALSETQLAWVQKIVHDANKPPFAGEQFVSIAAMLTVVNEGGIKNPILRAVHPDCPPLDGKHREEGVICLKWLRNSTKIAILSGDKEMFYGYMDKRGVTDRELPTLILETLQHTNKDLVRSATLYGRKTGACCFCGRELTREDSIGAGYGPICAEKWGLPHPYNMEVN